MLQTDLLSIQIKPFCPKPLLGTTRVCMMGSLLGSEVHSIPLSPYRPGHNDTYLLGDSQPPKQAPTLTPSSSCDFSLKRFCWDTQSSQLGWLRDRLLTTPPKPASLLWSPSRLHHLCSLFFSALSYSGLTLLIYSFLYCLPPALPQMKVPKEQVLYLL